MLAKLIFYRAHLLGFSWGEKKCDGFLLKALWELEKMEVRVWVGILMAGPTLQEMKDSCDRMNKGKNSVSFFPHIIAPPHTKLEIKRQSAPDLQWVAAATSSVTISCPELRRGSQLPPTRGDGRQGYKMGLTQKWCRIRQPTTPVGKDFHSTGRCKQPLTPTEDPCGSSHSPFPSQQNQS